MLMFQLLKPAAQVGPQSAYKVHKDQGRGLHGSLCGACQNCEEQLQATRNASWTDPTVHVYCFEVWEYKLYCYHNYGNTAAIVDQFWQPAQRAQHV